MVNKNINNALRDSAGKYVDLSGIAAEDIGSMLGIDKATGKGTYFASAKLSE